MSVILRIQTGMDRQVHGAKGGKGNPNPSGGNKKYPRPWRVPRQRESDSIRLRWTAKTARQVQMSTPEAEIEIQAKPLNPVQIKEMLQDHRVRVR